MVKLQGQQKDLSWQSRVSKNVFHGIKLNNTLIEYPMNIDEWDASLLQLSVNIV